MTEHYCNEHNCKFYRNEKNGRVWYSHKIKGGDGYCNEPKEETGEQESPSVETTPKPQPKPESRITDGKNKSYALSYAKDIACAMIKSGKEMSAAKVIDVAKVFERYLDGKEVQKASNLVEEAKKLGAKEIKKDG